MEDDAYHELEFELQPDATLESMQSPELLSSEDTFDSEYMTYSTDGSDIQSFNLDPSSYFSDETEMKTSEIGPEDVYSIYSEATTSETTLPSSDDTNLYCSLESDKSHKKREIDYVPIKDWQGEFQSFLKMNDSYEKFYGIARLGLDFQHAAALYARVIVSECKLPENQKTIHTANLGGVAGGIKVICQGILFKIAIDKYGLYGNDANAAKAAGHELKSTTAFFDLQLPNFQFPLMAIIDYRGFRVTAMSLLPISGRDTLLYGSSDGGRTVHTSDPKLNTLMDYAGKLLNLKPHYCGKTDPQLLSMPIDIEVHEVLKFKSKEENTSKDQKSTNTTNNSTSSEEEEKSYAVIDLARLFPPQMPLSAPVPGSKHRTYMYQLLRPEFVKTNPVPLSSDAFTSFNSMDPNFQENNEEVAAACDRLVTNRIPQFALLLERGTLPLLTPGTEIDCTRLVSSLHRHGINIRFLGFVRRHLKNPHLRRIVLTEMCSRVIKDQINEALRNMTQSVQMPVEEPYRDVVVDYLNQLFGPEANQFWETKLLPDLLKKFSLKKLELSLDIPFQASSQDSTTSNTDPNQLLFNISNITQALKTKPSLIDPKLLKTVQNASVNATEDSKPTDPLPSPFSRPNQPQTPNQPPTQIESTSTTNDQITASKSKISIQKQPAQMNLAKVINSPTNTNPLVSPPNVHMRDYLDPIVVWERVSELTGITLRKDAVQVMINGHGISSIDIKSLQSRVKIVDIVHRSLAIYIGMDAKTKFGTEAYRLFLRSHQLFRESLQVSASNASTFYYWGCMLRDMASHVGYNGRYYSLKLLKLGAIPRLAQAVHISPDMLDAHLVLSLTLVDFLLNQARFDAANNRSSTQTLSKDNHTIFEKIKQHLFIAIPSDEEMEEIAFDFSSALESTIGNESLSEETSSPSSLISRRKKITTTIRDSVKKTKEKIKERASKLSAKKDSNPSLKGSTNSASKDTTLSREGSSQALTSDQSESVSQSDQSDPVTTQNEHEPEEEHNSSHKTHRSGTSRPSKTRKKKHRTKKHDTEVYEQPETEEIPIIDDNGLVKRISQVEEKIQASIDSEFVVLLTCMATHFLLSKMIIPRASVLTNLDIQDASFIQNSSFILISTHCINLEHLSLRNATFLDSQTASLFLKSQNSFKNPASNLNPLSSSTPNTSSTMNTMSMNTTSISGSISKFGRLKTSPTILQTQAPAELYYPTFTKLKSLKFTICDLLTDIPHFESIYWPSLTSLEFSKCGVSDGFFKRICQPNTPLLTSLAIGGTLINDGSLTRISNDFGNQLHRLDLGICLNLQYASCFCLMVHNPVLTGFKQLTHLDLSGCKSLSSQSFSQFLKSPLTASTLTFINLDGCSSISDELLAMIPKKFPSLKEIRLERSMASNVTLTAISQHCKNLEKLCISSCKSMDPTALIKILQSCPKLTYLDASFWKWDKDVSTKLAKIWNPQTMPQQMNLESLFLCAWELDSQSILLFISRCPKLKVIDISNCTLGESTFATFATCCPKLEKVIANGFVLTDEAVDSLTQGCTELRNLSFARAYELTDKSLASLTRCSKLTKLILSHSPYITNSGIQMLVTALPSITKLGLRGSKLITPEFLFYKMRHACKTLTLDVDQGKILPWDFPLP